MIYSEALEVLYRGAVEDPDELVEEIVDFAEMITGEPVGFIQKQMLRTVIKNVKRDDAG